MPVTVTYPGVYIEEIPSGVHTISGVATSITAFVGRTARGPVNVPVTITSFRDFERTFGGLSIDSPVSYAVKDFYLNGGSTAVIVRLYKPGAAPAAANGASAASDAPARPPARRGQQSQAIAPAAPTSPGVATGQVDGGLQLMAANPGAWGNRIKVRVDHDGLQPAFAERYGLTVNDFFNLTVTDTAPHGQTERIVNVTLKDTPRRVDRVLVQSSQLVRVATQDGTLSAPPVLPDPETKLADTAFDPKNIASLPGLQGGADSAPLVPADYLGAGPAGPGIYALDQADLFNLLCIPPDTRDGDTDPSVYQAAAVYCRERRAMLIVDPPSSWQPDKSPPVWMQRLIDLGLSGEEGRYAAVFYPRLVQADPLRENQLDTFVPCGAIAGIMARTDTERGVWKAPAGIGASVAGIRGLAAPLTDADSGALNPLGINAIRTFPVYGTVVWGSRTLRGADLLADDYKYIPIRRLTNYIEESLFRGTKWILFEPNDEPLWAQIRMNVEAFMADLFRRGAFQGNNPGSAYFVRCGADTTTQYDVDRGIVNIQVGFAPLKPAEFVIISLQQMAGQSAA
jgi:phage tail sheath protein FI